VSNSIILEHEDGELAEDVLAIITCLQQENMDKDQQLIKEKEKPIPNRSKKIKLLPTNRMKTISLLMLQDRHIINCRCFTKRKIK